MDVEAAQLPERKLNGFPITCCLTVTHMPVSSSCLIVPQASSSPLQPSRASMHSCLPTQEARPRSDLLPQPPSLPGLSGKKGGRRHASIELFAGVSPRLCSWQLLVLTNILFKGSTTSALCAEVIVPRSVATTTGARPTVTPVPTPVPITGGRTGVQTRVDPSVPSRTSTTPTSPSRVPSTTDTVGHAVETAVDIADAALESPDTPDSLETPESTGSASDLPDSEIYQNPVPNGQPVVSPVASAPLDAQAPQGDSADIDCDPYTSGACSIEGSIPG